MPFKSKMKTWCSKMGKFGNIPAKRGFFKKIYNWVFFLIHMYKIGSHYGQTMNGSLLRIVNSSELEKNMWMKDNCKDTIPWRVVHMLKCNLGLPDVFGVDVTAGSVHTCNMWVGLPTWQIQSSLSPQTSETSLKWPSLITEGSHHFTETKVYTIRILFFFL